MGRLSCASSGKLGTAAISPVVGGEIVGGEIVERVLFRFAVAIVLVGLVAAGLSSNNPASGLLRSDAKLRVAPNESVPLYTWRSAGAMSTSRANGATATTLQDGRVLVAGGMDATEHFHASAELYDPVTNAWSATSDMPHPRVLATATLLNDGRVLVAGGLCDQAAGAPCSPAPDESADVIIYDPTLGTWTTGPQLDGPRMRHTATLLQDGRVLIAGGFDGSFAELDTAIVIDPASQTWMPTGPMPGARQDHRASLLGDGRVLVTGGFCTATALWCGSDETPSGTRASSVIYNPATNAWTQTNPMTSARHLHAQHTLPDGRALVAGGSGDSGTELFDPASGRWSAGAPTLVPTFDPASGLLPGGRVILAGGRLGAPTSTAQIYHPALNVWLYAGTLATPRAEAVGAALNGGGFLIAGGHTGVAVPALGIGGEDTIGSAEVNYPFADPAEVQIEARVNL